MVLVLLTPVIWLPVRYVPQLTIATAILFWLVTASRPYSGAIASAAFFIIGACLGHRLSTLRWLDGITWLVAPVYLCVGIADACTKEAEYNPWLHDVGMLFGMALAWAVAGAIHRTGGSWRKALMALPGASFFVFAAHQPLLTFVRGVLKNAIHPQSDAAILVLYYAVPILTVLICLAANYLLRRFTPLFAAIITGGR
jgi:hypothetical protein